MQSNRNYKSLEILKAYEAGDETPALEIAISDPDNAGSIAQFIAAVDGVITDFTKGAPAEGCMELIRDAIIARIECWGPESSIRDAIESTSYGSVYALVNQSMPGVYKVGFTTGMPKKRADQLSSATGVPTPFVVLFSYETINCKSVEARIHKSLSDKRINQGREFFRCDIGELGAAFESAVTTEYKSHGFDPDGPVMRASEFYPDADLARYRCELFLKDRHGFFNPEPANMADNPFQ